MTINVAMQALEKRSAEMGTKDKPGTYDCYSRAEPDEPMFVLLGRDVTAPLLVTLWAYMRTHLKGFDQASSEDKAQIFEAMDCAGAMAEWLELKDKDVGQVFAALEFAMQRIRDVEAIRRGEGLAGRGTGAGGGSSG
jgi:hypothetical protein